MNVLSYASLPQHICSPFFVDRKALGMLVNGQKCDNRMIPLQISVSIDDHSFVPPTILAPAYIIGVLGVILHRQKVRLKTSLIL